MNDSGTSKGEKMKKLITIVAVLGIVALFTIVPAIACDGPDCESAWVGGENNASQWQDFYRQNLSHGGIQETNGAQSMDMWGGVRNGEYQAEAMQAEGMNLVKDIPGGQIFNEHVAYQAAQMDLEGRRANANISGSNEFSNQTAAFADKWHAAEGWGVTMGSENHSNLNMEGSLCLEGKGDSASYEAEVIQSTGHYQELTFPDGMGSGFTTSLSNQRGAINLSE